MSMMPRVVQVPGNRTWTARTASVPGGRLAGAVRGDGGPVAAAGITEALRSVLRQVDPRSLIEAGWSAEAAVAARVGIASLLLAVPTAVALRGRARLLRRNLGVVGMFGLLAVVGAQVGFFNAIRYLPVGVALLLEYLGTFLVVVWLWAAHGQRPRRLTVAGSAAAMVGLAFVLDLTGGVRIDPVGVLWGLFAAVGLASYFVLSARVDPELPSMAMASGGMAVGSGTLLLLGAFGPCRHTRPSAP
jgi:drug/metabolite transporter (DMT)-like permease